MPSLATRLKDLGLKKGSHLAMPEKAAHLSLADTLNANLIQNQFGSVVVVEKCFPYGYQHGDVKFNNNMDTNIIHKAGMLTTQTENLNRLIFLDTETTGLAGGTGTLAFLVGIARFDDQGLKLTQFVLEDPADETALLLAFSNVVSDVEAVVTFNGKSFDLPLLKARFVLNRFPVPFSNWGHLDLLHLSRKIWRQRLENRGLKDLEQEILHIPRSSDDIPGWMIPEIYFNFLRSGDASLISNVVYHNAMDIVSLAALYIKITQLLDQVLSSKNLHILDVYGIGQVFERIGELYQSAEIYLHCLKNMQSSSPKTIEIRSRLASIYKKQNNFGFAVPLWQSNGELGDFESCIELAKYHEHEIRDYSVALTWTTKAYQNLDQLIVTRYKKNTIKKELAARKLRLENRIKDV